MAQKNINISVVNNTVGEITSRDGVMGLFCKAIAVAGKFTLDTAYLLTQLSDLETLGIDAAYDTTNGVAVYQHVSEYYAQAGDGAYLWLVGVDKASAFATYVAGETFKQLIRGTANADPANRVKMIALAFEVPTATQSTADFPTDVTDSITALQATKDALFQEGYQFSGIIDGYNMSSTVTIAALGTLTNKECPSVSLCVTGSKGNGVSSVGAALGRFASITIGHGFGAVKDGAVALTTAYLTNGITTSTAKNVAKLTPTEINALGSKQFMFLRTWFGHTGFYWNDGATCEDPAKQLSTQEYNRVANAFAAYALAFFIDEINSNLPLNSSTGAVDSTYLSAKQKEFYDSYISPKTVASGSGDLTDASLTVTGPNFNSTKTLKFVLKIVPTPILGTVDGTIEFTSTL